jgi:hypothetical protein
MIRTAKVAGLCLASMLVMGMALAGTASATELLWLVCLKGTGLTRYTNSRCLEAGSGEWQSEGVPTEKSITVKILAISIVLRDTGSAAKSAVSCFENGSVGLGLIGPNGTGEIKEARYENAKANCRGVEGCEKEGVEKVEGVNLPWKQELVVGANGKPLGRILPGPSGKLPGYEVKCKVAGLPVTDICEEEKGFPEEVELINEVTKNPEGVLELLVRSRFQEVGHAKCSIGGANASKILGLTAVLLPGGALSIITSP